MIAEYSTYRIRGNLVFSGEYEARKSGETSHPLILDRSANYNKRLVRQIHHHIPVDITLPAERIDENGVVMEITSLDYDLVDPNQLIVTTEIELQGVRQEEERPQETIPEDEVLKNIYFEETTENFSRTRGWDEVVEQVNHTLAENEESQDRLHVEEVKEQAEDEAEPLRSDETSSDHQEEQEEVEIRVEMATTENANVEEQREETEMVQSDIENTNRLEDPVAAEMETRPTEEDVESEVKVTISNKRETIEETSVVQSESDVNVENAKSKSASILSDILKNREDTMTQIHICLVQPGETIQDIAYRYNIDEEEILRANNISIASSIGGKVLKIPVRKAR